MRLAAWLFVFGLAVSNGAVLAARTGGIEIGNPRLALAEEGGYVLSADFRVDFNARLEEAVAQGVTLFFVMEFELERPRWYWTDEKVVEKRQTWRLSYHALTRQYRLSTGALHQSFPTLEEALQMLSRLYRWPVIDAPLKPGDSYRAALRFSLDMSQLPKPFQVSALMSRDWNLDSGWIHWDFRVPAPLPAPPSPPAPAPQSPDAQTIPPVPAPAAPEAQ